MQRVGRVVHVRGQYGQSPPLPHHLDGGKGEATDWASSIKHSVEPPLVTSQGSPPPQQVKATLLVESVSPMFNWSSIYCFPLIKNYMNRTTVDNLIWILNWNLILPSLRLFSWVHDNWFHASKLPFFLLVWYVFIIKWKSSISFFPIQH